jgi:hypothetical protein
MRVEQRLTARDREMKHTLLDKVIDECQRFAAIKEILVCQLFFAEQTVATSKIAPMGNIPADLKRHRQLFHLVSALKMLIDVR